MLIFRKWGWTGLVPPILATPFGVALPAWCGDLVAGLVCALAGVGLWFLGRRLNGKHPLRSAADLLEAGLLERIRRGGTAAMWQPASDSSVFFVRLEYFGLFMVLLGGVTALLRPFARGLFG